jgi:radical SAM protein with 4Fe4S-binding SPASM domain
MLDHAFSLILLPTLACNADCDYCFENKAGAILTLDQLSVLTHKVLQYLQHQTVQHLTIYWQGGEVMMLPPQWLEHAYHIIQRAADASKISVAHSLQSNMLGYHPGWNSILAEMFGSSVGSSMDFPNRHRKFGGSAEDYTARWTRNVRDARDAGIETQIIAIPNQETLAIGAERFYAYVVDELQITNFQINTPFPGGTLNDVKQQFPLDADRFRQFVVDLIHVWIERGYHQGVLLGPFDEFLRYFLDEDPCIPCIWRENCTDEFLCIDAYGNVAQCDCWVASYPEYWFGNIFDASSLLDLLQGSEVHRRFQSRPEVLIRQESCLECEYLALCHGGCPIRAYSSSGHFFEKDPYCSLYPSMFSYLEEIASQLAGSRVSSTSTKIRTSPTFLIYGFPAIRNTPPRKEFPKNS